MNLLAFDTSTDVLSIAVARGAAAADLQIWHHAGAGGAQASAALIPAILQLMAQAGLTLNQLDAIAFGRGPGSFTGLRTACSVAQGLALGAGVPVLPIDTLLAVAEDARHQLGNPAQLHLIAVLDARMDQVYSAHCAFESGRWTRQGDYRLSKPEELLDGTALASSSQSASHPWRIAGNASPVYGARLPALGLPPIPALPSALAMLRLAPQLLGQGLALAADQALPLYIRDKVAQTTAERELERGPLKSAP